MNARMDGPTLVAHRAMGGRRISPPAERARGVARVTPLVVAVALAVAPVVARAVTLDDLRGSIGVGYSRLFLEHAPGGSLSATAGLSLPIRGAWSAGVGVGFHLLGSRNVLRGSLLAGVDYSLFEAGLFAHWSPEGLGPVGRISLGPEIMSARAELSTSGGGAGFRDLAVEQAAAGVGLDVTMISRRPSPVRLGLELGERYAFLPGDDWSVATARLVFHY